MGGWKVKLAVLGAVGAIALTVASYLKAIEVFVTWLKVTTAAGGFLLGAIIALLLVGVVWWIDQAKASSAVSVQATELATAQKRLQAARYGLKLMHEATEVVRRCALDESFSDRSLHDQARSLLETKLNRYLVDRLGGQNYSVTLKWFQSGRLRVIFRDCEQSDVRKQGDDTEPLEGNYFLDQFGVKVHHTNDLRCLIIHDTNAPELPDALRVRSSKRKYRSCLTLPLNLPVGDGLATGLAGFLGIDSPNPFAFKDFFQPVDPARQLGNTGENHNPTEDLQLIYGLADAVAAMFAIAFSREGKKNLAIVANTGMGQQDGR